jgi:hypothetical protein
VVLSAVGGLTLATFPLQTLHYYSNLGILGIQLTTTRVLCRVAPRGPIRPHRPVDMHHDATEAEIDTNPSELNANLGVCRRAYSLPKNHRNAQCFEKSGLSGVDVIPVAKRDDTTTVPWSRSAYVNPK